ncbi:cadmium-sensing regulator, CadC [Marininema mesophilum]|uniref:Cadmium-sensing regulator, CadC n=1 Tax=Marininema mesophilum TaxID=1048340 RepID=A0A1H2ZPB9_9BACL|nr:metalloregulator ArsR/SmtB family transcription factor [Marininema mesophilum]SDX19111.1 cadmium-sensing regulator, CadC [Marininema mesophilum]
MTTSPANTTVKTEDCEIFCSNTEKVQQLKNQLPDMERIAAIFKACGDATRMKMMVALTQEKELCVCDFAHLLDISVATASHHLRLLKNGGLTHSRKEGKLVYYSLTDGEAYQLIASSMKYGNR